MHPSEDAYSGHCFTESELAWFLMCTLVVEQTVTYLISVGKLAWLLMCVFLVT